MKRLMRKILLPIVAVAIAGLATNGPEAISKTARGAPGGEAPRIDQDAKPDPKKWDVAEATGPTTPLTFDTNEGTWMNLDVSPDGTQIVFDLLGDIYLMPIAGTATPARRLTSGPVFDMQPRFSPDGKRIAITSDRDGLWNIWSIDLQGGDARQISRERRWFVNSPTWSPDGAYIYARRHFVKERSLGAGEIWMYHSGGPSDGLQVTERASWQKDAGEPDVSPDGTTLFYSKDVTPGQTFEYNKDPNGTIYAIIRRDLTTGRERRAVSIQGGSVTPQISPDGKSLAYLRRVRLQSFLYVRDLESGRDRQLFGNVDKDLQEAWAIHGLYPQYSWTPDGKSIVIWGETKSGALTLRRERASRSPSRCMSSKHSTPACVCRAPCTRPSSRSGCFATFAFLPTGRSSSTAPSATCT